MNRMKATSNLRDLASIAATMDSYRDPPASVRLAAALELVADAMEASSAARQREVIRKAERFAGATASARK